MSFTEQVKGLTVGDAIELNRLTVIYDGLGPNGEALHETV